MTDLSDLKPTPPANPDTEAYWDGLKRGELLLQQCTACHAYRHYPQPMCPYCHSMDYQWTPSKRLGRIYSWTETHHAFNPGFKGELPYILVTVDLDEGVRLNAQLRDADIDELKIGRESRVDFEVGNGDLVYPIIRLL